MGLSSWKCNFPANEYVMSSYFRVLLMICICASIKITKRSNGYCELIIQRESELPHLLNMFYIIYI